MNHPAILLSADLASVLLVTDSTSELWSAPSLPESPDASELRARIDETSRWVAGQPSVRRRLSVAVLDITDATCRWVHSPSAAAPVVAATLRSQTEEWSAKLPLGGIEPIIDDLPTTRSFEFIRSRLESRSALDRSADRATDPTNTSATDAGARMAVLTMPDALVRLWLDRMDRSGIAVDSVISLWHALALAWGDDAQSQTQAVLLVDGSGRIAWAWATGASLIVGGSLQLERPDTSEADPPHRHRAEAAAQRISLDWVSWSAQLGIAPDQIHLVAAADDPLAKDLLDSLSTRWEGIPAKQTRSDHPLRETVARAGAAIRSTPRAERGPRRCLSRLSSRPTRATRRRYLAMTCSLVLLAGAIVSLGYRLMQEGRDRYSRAAEIRSETLAMVSRAVPDFNPNQNISIQLRQRVTELQEAPTFNDPPAPRPIYESMFSMLDFIEAEYPEAKIRKIKFSQGGTPANELEIDMPSLSDRTRLLADLSLLGPAVDWQPRTRRGGNPATVTTVLDLIGTWRQEATP
jgi:hypothetical protein